LCEPHLSSLLSFIAGGHIIACSSNFCGVWEIAVEMFYVKLISYMNCGGVKLKYSCKSYVMFMNFRMYKSVIMKELYTVVECLTYAFIGYNIEGGFLCYRVHL
jgi:hypothetical protein